MVKTGQQWSGLAVTRDSTGALAAASVGPVGTLYVDGTANGAGVTVTGANPYKWTVTLPALTAGQTVSMYLTATVATIATAAVVAEDVAAVRGIDDLAFPTTSGRSIDVTATGAVGIDWSNVEAPTTTVGLSGTTVKAVTDGVSLANDAITSAKFDESTAFPIKAADSGSTYIARTGADSDTLETLSDQIDGVEPADVWAYATRTLTATAASTVSAVTGSALTITAGATYSATLSGMTIPADWLKVWFTLKTDEAQTDAQALVQIVASNPGVGTDGLKHLNGAVATSALQGSLTVNQAGGTVAIEIEAVATVQLDRASALGYDLKVLSGIDTVTLLTSGTASVQLTETKSIT